MSRIEKDSGHVQGHDGTKVFYRSWLPESPVGSMVIAHGAGEHSGRYDHVGTFFAEQGLAVYALDHRGHGQSGGVRMYVERFGDYLTDLAKVVEVASAHGKPIMLGHSMGGLISFQYASRYTDTIRALILTSPWLTLRLGPNPIEKIALPLLKRVWPALQMKTKIDPNTLCTDPEVCRTYANDPLLGRTVTPGWYVECQNAAASCLQLAPNLDLPCFILQGGADALMDPAGAQALFDVVGSRQKAFQNYPTLYHEILNEPQRFEIMTEILQWLKQQDLVASTL